MTAHRVDVHGNPFSGPVDGIALYDEAVGHLLALRPEVVPSTRRLLADAPDLAMAHVFAAYLALSSTDPADVPHARAAAGALAGLPLGEREAAHREAVAAWLDGDWHGAAARLDDLLIRWPSDLLALFMGHQLDFFLGDAHNLRDRVGRSLYAVDPGHPHHGFVRGMYAFGLEESGHYPQAEAHGLAALERNPRDVWALHAVVHTHEMRGQVDEGLRLMRDRETDWGADNLFAVHNWWHLALFLLEAGRPDQALEVYDARIHSAGSAGVPLELLDASALLWRLVLDDADTGGRFGPLADAWAARAADDPWYAFNDLHATMALAGAGRLGDARAVVSRLDRYAEAGGAAGTDRADGPGGGHRSNVAMTAEIGLPACRAVVAFAEQRHDDAVAELLPIRRVLHRFGGSHAQRDVLQRTLLEAAIRSDRLDLARALLSERLAARETSVYALGRWSEVLRRQGDPAAAADADARAAAQRDRFAAAP